MTNTNRDDIEPLKIVVPSRRSALIRSQRTRGTIILAAGTEREERIPVPVAVAKWLEKKQTSSDFPLTSRDDVLKAIDASALKCAIRRVEGLVNRRDYSVEEIRRKLSQDGYGQMTVEAVIGSAKRGHVLDDMRFASVFIRSKLGAGWGTYRIERELSRRGIELKDVPGWPEAFIDAEAEPDRAFRLVEHRRLSGKNDYAKLVRFLVGKGFSLHDAKVAAAQRLRESTASTDTSLI